MEPPSTTPIKKKFLFVSVDSNIADIAWQVVKEGHNVKLYIDSSEFKEVGDGFVPKTDDWKKEIGWADIIVFDDVEGQGAKAKKLRDEGKLVVGGTPFTDLLEDNRAFGQNEMKNAGIPIMPQADFTSFDEAIVYVQQNPGQYVIKPSGTAQNQKGLLFVGEEEDGKDVIKVLESYKKVYANKIKSFQLQKRIKGVEVAVGGFFNGKEFITPINVNFEHKRLFPGELGVATGEMGTSMFWSEPNKIFNHTLKKMEPKLAEEKFVGYIDINCIVNSNGIYPLEFTARFGYPTIAIQQEGMISPMGEFLFELARGTTYKLKCKSGFQLGVYIVVPPFPYQDRKTFEAYSKDAVITFKKPEFNGIHIEDVKKVDNEWVVTGDSGIVLLVCGTGQTMRDAQKMAYNRIKNIRIPNMYYRKDIGDRWFEDTDKLHSWGYLREN
ncbi:MAG: phosphoribosylamine--glycine ligase [Candidatus Diapherotrites archaeon]|uniref:phosphoribosylamine--glycine ligase n=1 Tax=Candidatus Iainarchaeum sp. TaxID=3101447 RepID=A0A8T4L8E2_9ARCH|nr:phosphoribosylamine--glycine ligase [Candidatus Diapherotrites archaeon]